MQGHILMGHSSRFYGDADLGIPLGVAVLRRGEGQPRRETAAKSRAVSQGSQCQVVPAWEAYEVQVLAPSLPTSSMVAAGHCSLLSKMMSLLIVSTSRTS